MRAQWRDTPAHACQNYQAQIRLMVKLRFLTGLARRLAAMAGLVEGMVAGIEAEGRMHNGYFVPSTHLLYAAQTLTQELYPQASQIIRDLAGGGVVMLPSPDRVIANPKFWRLIEETQVSPVTDARGRVALMKLAWDAIGSEVATRHTRYDMFYRGASHVNHA